MIDFCLKKTHFFPKGKCCPELCAARGDYKPHPQHKYSYIDLSLVFFFSINPAGWTEKNWQLQRGRCTNHVMLVQQPHLLCYCPPPPNWLKTLIGSQSANLFQSCPMYRRRPQYTRVIEGWFLLNRPLLPDIWPMCTRLFFLPKEGVLDQVYYWVLITKCNWFDPNVYWTVVIFRHPP